MRRAYGATLVDISEKVGAKGDGAKKWREQITSGC